MRLGVGMRFVAVAVSLLALGGCFFKINAVGLEKDPDDTEATTFVFVRVKNTTKRRTYGHMELEITGNRMIPLDDGAGERHEPFLLRVSLKDAVVGPRELRVIPLKDAVVPGQVDFFSVNYRLTKYRKVKVKPRPTVVIDKTK